MNPQRRLRLRHRERVSHDGNRSVTVVDNHSVTAPHAAEGKGRRRLRRKIAVVLPLLFACAESDSEPFEGPYPVEQLLVDIGDYHWRWCACDITNPYAPLGTAEECIEERQDLGTPAWHEGESKWVCLDRLGHMREHHDNPWITVCAPMSMAAHDEKLAACDSGDKNGAAYNAIEPTPLCLEQNPAAKAFEEVLDDCAYAIDSESATSEGASE